MKYALTLLEKDTQERVVVRATGKAISTALVVVQAIKQRFGNLHQVNKIYSMQVVDVYEPKDDT